MAELSIDGKISVIASLRYCYTVGEFKKRYLPILNLLNVDGPTNAFQPYYDEVYKKIVGSADETLLSVQDAGNIIKLLDGFTTEYKLVTSEKDKIEFVKEIVKSLQIRNIYISDVLDVEKAKEKTEPKDFFIELEMFNPYKNIPEFKPIIAALEENKEKYLEQPKDFKDFGVEKVQSKVINEKPVIDFVNQHKDHKWNVTRSSRSQRLELFSISHNDLQAISEIKTVFDFKNCFKSVFEKLYQKDDNGHKKRFKNRIGNSLDKAIDRIRKEMNSDKYEDGSIVSSYMAKGIKELLQFNINELESYCTHNTKQSPNKKAMVAEIVRKLEQAQDNLPKLTNDGDMIFST